MYATRGKHSSFSIGIFLVLSTLCFSYDLKILKNPIRDVITGKEQTVIISYILIEDNTNDTDAKLRITGPEGNTIKSFYDIRDEANNTGTVYLHFLQVQDKDLGNYSLFINNSLQHVIYVRGTTPPTDIYKILLYVLPAIFFAFACCVVVVSVVTIRRKRICDSKVQKPKVKKNPYVKSGAGLPAPKPTSQPSNVAQQFSRDEPRVNTVSRNNSPPPPVTKRTTSLHHTNQQNVPLNGNTPVVSFQRQNMNRQSMDSVESWDDGEDEYENTCQAGFSSAQQQNPTPFYNQAAPTKHAPHNPDNNTYLTSTPVSSSLANNLGNLNPSFLPTDRRFQHPNIHQATWEAPKAPANVMVTHQQRPMQRYPSNPLSPKPKGNSSFATQSQLQVCDDVYDEVSLE